MSDLKKNRAIWSAVVVLFLSACSTAKTIDPSVIKEGFETKPEGYDQLMYEANQMRGSGNVKKAREYYASAARDAENQFGTNDGRVANALLCEAAVAKDTGQNGEAEKLYKRAYEIDKAILNPNSPDFIDVKKQYATILLLNFKGEEAKKIDPTVHLNAAPSRSPRGRHGRH